MFCFHLGIAPKGGGGVKACPDVLGNFFPTFARGERACQDGLGLFSPTSARLTEGGSNKSTSTFWMHNPYLSFFYTTAIWDQEILHLKVHLCVKFYTAFKI